MTYPPTYLPIKKIFDFALFDVEDADEHFKKNEKISFSERFQNYQIEFLEDSTYDWNIVLLDTCREYLEKFDSIERVNILKIVVENQVLSESLIFTAMLSDNCFDSEAGNKTFMDGLSSYVLDKKMYEPILEFLQQHFLNLQRIDPANFENFELNKSEYLELVADYLKVQSNIC